MFSVVSLFLKTIHWQPEMFNGFMTINGSWADGTPLMAIPNYIRNNRMGTLPVEDRTPTSIIWIKE
jgi:hypothetical protein